MHNKMTKHRNSLPVSGSLEPFSGKGSIPPFSKVLEDFLQCEPVTDDVYESILEARREDAKYAANHANDREAIS